VDGHGKNSRYVSNITALCFRLKDNAHLAKTKRAAT
jgi:hypothetical protein